MPTKPNKSVLLKNLHEVEDAIKEVSRMRETYIDFFNKKPKSIYRDLKANQINTIGNTVLSHSERILVELTELISTLERSKIIIQQRVKKYDKTTSS
jgi:uncharacterized protein YbcI